MKRRTLLAGAAALGAARPGLATAQGGGKVKVVFWHAMTNVLNEQVNKLVSAFNASQGAVEVQAVFKGTYAETMTATIAAWRAGQAPHIAQIFEVGTANMLAAGRAVKEAWQLSKETGVAIRPEDYIASVRGYYSLADGRMAGIPFNSSTAVMWYNKDAFEKAGLDPSKPPATWDELVKACDAVRSKQTAPIPMTTAWPSWIQLEQYSAIHNIPFATEADGFKGLDAKLTINSKPHVAHIQRLLDMAKAGTFKYGGRGSAADPLFPSGQAAVSFNSSGVRGDVARSAKFKWGEAFLPYDPGVIKQPINSIIGGAALWAMTAPNRSPAEYKGAAQFLAFISRPENVAQWHENTGYVPITLAGFEVAKKQGFYEKNPGADLPIAQLTRGHVTEYSRGIRLGRLPEIRNIIEEELEKAVQGKQDAQAALDSAVERGNRVLREFQRSVKT